MTTETLSFESVPDPPPPCPRCGGEANGRFYGPCVACRVHLNAAMIRPTPLKQGALFLRLNERERFEARADAEDEGEL